MEAFADFFGWLEGLSPLWAYAAILAIAYGENVVPPVPGDMVVVFGGYLAGIGQLDLPVVVLLGTLGGAAGFMTMFALGYRVGDAVMAPDRLTWLPKDQVHRVHGWLHRWGYGVVAANRFLSGARSVISLAVGMAHMAPGRTFVWATFSALVWTLLITWAGYAVGENWEAVRGWLAAYGRVMVTLLLLAAAVVAGRWWWRRRRMNRP